ncbi:hypothetical protein MMC15_002481 [Xylographa vitiligo]|nr:hypothetical protein [Xylographa vitiligo]
MSVDKDVTKGDNGVVDKDPDPTIDHYLPKDELKEMAELQEGEKAELPNLRYPINPIFRRQRWVDITDRQWTLVEPVLRLASAFFETEASFVLLYSIINAPQVRIPRVDPTEFDKYEIHRLDPLKHYRHARLEFSQNIALFGDNLWWRITDMKQRGSGHEATDCYGRTQRYDVRVFQYSNSERKDIVGNGALISMHERFWHMLETLETYKSTPNAVSMAKLVTMTLGTHIHMAVTFCHELAHMVNIASHEEGHRTECFWEDDAVAEYGRVWEQEVFGGAVRQQTPFTLDEPSYVVKWPDIYTVEWATHDKDLTRELSKGSSTYYVVPVRWMVEVTSQRFWDQYFLTRSRTLLWIPKRFGLRLVFSDKDLPWWRLSQSSEGYYPGDDSNIVRRNWVSEIPSLNKTAHDSPGPPSSRTRARTAEKRRRRSDVADPQSESDRASKRTRV